MAVEKIYDDMFFRLVRNHFRDEWRSNSRVGFDLEDRALSRITGLPAQMFLVCLIEKANQSPKKRPTTSLLAVVGNTISLFSLHREHLSGDSSSFMD